MPGARGVFRKGYVVEAVSLAIYLMDCGEFTGDMSKCEKSNKKA